jgi:hypothetical protein
MSILRGFKLSRLILLTLVCLISLSTLNLNGCSDDWVYVCKNKYNIFYYKRSSVKIYKSFGIIEVLVKKIYTKEGVSRYLNELDSDDKQRFADIDYGIILWLLNYHLGDCSIANVTMYSKSNNVLSDNKYDVTKRLDIKSDSMIATLIDKIIKDYNIKR